MTERRNKGHGRPWEYGDYSDMDLLDYPGNMTPGEREIECVGVWV